MHAVVREVTCLGTRPGPASGRRGRHPQPYPSLTRVTADLEPTFVPCAAVPAVDAH